MANKDDDDLTGCLVLLILIAILSAVYNTNSNEARLEKLEDRQSEEAHDHYREPEEKQ